MLDRDMKGTDGNHSTPCEPISSSQPDRLGTSISHSTTGPAFLGTPMHLSPALCPGQHHPSQLAPS